MKIHINSFKNIIVITWEIKNLRYYINASLFDAHSVYDKNKDTSYLTNNPFTILTDMFDNGYIDEETRININTREDMIKEYSYLFEEKQKEI